MKVIIDSISKAIESQNYFGALFMALTIPDICASIDNPRETHKGKRYKKWFQENLKEKYYPDNKLEFFENTAPEFASTLKAHERETLRATALGDMAFTDEMCWKLRCSVLHAGSTDAGRFTFHLTHGGSHQNVVFGVLQLSVVNFCHDICNAFEIWCEKNKENEDVQRRLAAGMVIQNNIAGGIYMG